MWSSRAKARGLQRRKRVRVLGEGAANPLVSPPTNYRVLGERCKFPCGVQGGAPAARPIGFSCI